MKIGDRVRNFLLFITIILLTGCSNYNPKKQYIVNKCQQELVAGMEIDASKKIDKIVVLKKKRVMLVYKDNKRVATFRVSLGKNADKGPKEEMGDYKTPEGSYEIVRKRCHPKHYRSLMISYPNKKDLANAQAKGINPGGYITIHGQPKWNADGHGNEYTLKNDWTEGCIAVPNVTMDELWRAVDYGVKVTIKS